LPENSLQKHSEYLKEIFLNKNNVKANEHQLYGNRDVAYFYILDRDLNQGSIYKFFEFRADSNPSAHLYVQETKIENCGYLETRDKTS
jgi:hypothetical protein